MGSGIQDRIEHDHGLPETRCYQPFVPSHKMNEGTRNQTLHDNVNNPKHYQLLPGVEVIDVRKAIFKQIPEGTTPFAIDAYSRALEYLMRMWSKNGLEDAQKAQTYLTWLIEELKGTEK